MKGDSMFNKKTAIRISISESWCHVAYIIQISEYHRPHEQQTSAEVASTFTSQFITYSKKAVQSTIV